jgi:hypothetical protein
MRTAVAGTAAQNLIGADNGRDLERMNPALITCADCGKEISKFATHCPGCGAPNKWIDPRISEFLQSSRLTSEGFQYVHTGHTVRGWTEPKYSLSIYTKIAIGLGLAGLP